MNAGMFFQMMGGTSSTTAKTSGTQKTGSFSNSGESFKLEMEKAFDVSTKESTVKQPQTVNKKDDVKTDKGSEKPKTDDTANKTVTDENVVDEKKDEVCEENVVVAQVQNANNVVDNEAELLKQVEGIIDGEDEMMNLTEGEDNLLSLKQESTLEADGKILAQSNADLVKSAMLKGGEIKVESETDAKNNILEGVEIQIEDGTEESTTKVVDITSEQDASLQNGENAADEMFAQEGVKMSNDTLDLSKVNIKVADAPIDTARSDAAQQMADKIIYKLSQGKHVFDMELNPANLGKINVKMIFDNGNAEIIMTTSSAKAHQLLSSQTDALRAILEQTLGTSHNIDIKHAEQAAEQFDRDNFQEQSNDKGQQQEKDKRKNNEDVSFVDKLRLGLTELEFDAV